MLRWDNVSRMMMGYYCSVPKRERLFNIWQATSSRVDGRVYQQRSRRSSLTSIISMVNGKNSQNSNKQSSVMIGQKPSMSSVTGTACRMIRTYLLPNV